jgi:hypothetical protein
VFTYKSVELLHSGQLAGREVRLDGIERLLERFLVRNFPRHQEAKASLMPESSVMLISRS